MDELNIITEFDVTPEEVYAAWLDSEIHSEITGSRASIDPTPGGKFTAGDGYISGQTVELEPNKRIVQRWRTTEFPEGSPDSLLVLVFEPIDDDGCRLTMEHTEIPTGQGDDYLVGWEEHYFEPMREYFGEYEY